MLSIDVRLLSHHAERVAGEIPPSDPVWQDADVLPATPVSVAGRVSAAGGGRYYWSGHLEGTAQQLCRRCLEPVEVSVAEDIRAIFAEPGAEGDDDPDVYPVEPGSLVLDVRPAVREHWLLTVPRFALCKEDCKGLCPTCGENLNITSCSCEPFADSRWEALRKVRND